MSSILLVIACTVVVLFLGRVVYTSGQQLRAPFDLIYETPNAATVELIRDGRNPYAPDVYSEYPFILTIYTPLYHYLVANLPQHPENRFFTGRLVSATAMVLAAGLLFFVRPAAPFPIALVAFGIFFSFWPVVSNTAFLKNDPLALLFSASAVLLVHRYRSSTWTPSACAALCVAAIATKQSYVAATLVCALSLWVSARHQLSRFLLSGLVFSGAFVALVVAFWGPGFWFSTIAALRQEISIEAASAIVGTVARQPLAPGLLLVTCAAGITSFRLEGKDIFRQSPFPIYVGITAITLLLTLGKKGASTNYFFEFFLAQLFWSVYAFGGPRRKSFRRHRIVLVVLSVCWLIDPLVARTSDYSLVTPETRAFRNALYERLRSKVEALGFDDPIVLSPFPFTHGLVYGVGNSAVLSDPYLYSLLWKDGILELQPMLRTIGNGSYDVVIIPRSVSTASRLDAGYTEIVAAVFAHYRPAATVGPLRLLVKSD